MRPDLPSRAVIALFVLTFVLTWTLNGQYICFQTGRRHGLAR